MEHPATNRPWFGLIAIALGVAIIVADTTIVNVILPSIDEGLGATAVQGQWIQESYAIVFAALLLVSGRIADIVGARRLFITGVVVFGVTSLLAGLAPTSSTLIVARFLQGAGAAMILPTSLSLVNASFTGKARSQAFAVWGSTIGAAAALGPLLGGWLSEHLSWRWAFGINIPIVLVVIAGTLAFLAPSPRRTGRVDVPGAVLSAVGLGLLAFGLIEGRNYGWWATVAPMDLFGFTWDRGPSPVLVALVVAVAALAGFVRRQQVLTRSDHAAWALMDVRLFSLSSFRNGNIVTLIISLGEFGIVAVLPLWLQFTLGFNAFQTGLMLVPVAVGSFFASGASFGMAATVSPLNMLRIGLALETVGLAGLGVIVAVSSPWWHVALPLFVYGIGIGFATAQVTNVVLHEIPERSAGQGSGIQSAFRQLGTALGIAVLTTTFFTTMASTMRTRLSETGLSTGQVGRFTDTVTHSAGAVIDQLASQPATAAVAEAGRSAMTSGIATGSFIAAGLVLVGLIASVFIPATPIPTGQAATEPVPG